MGDIEMQKTITKDFLTHRSTISNLAGLFIKHRLSLVPCTAVNDANMMVFYMEKEPEKNAVRDSSV